MSVASAKIIFYLLLITCKTEYIDSDVKLNRKRRNVLFSNV